MGIAHTPAGVINTPGGLPIKLGIGGWLYRVTQPRNRRLKTLCGPRDIFVSLPHQAVTVRALANERSKGLQKGQADLPAGTVHEDLSLFPFWNMPIIDDEPIKTARVLFFYS